MIPAIFYSMPELGRWVTREPEPAPIVPLEHGVAYAVEQWAKFCRNNEAAGRARFDDGKLYFCNGWVPREQTEGYYVAAEKRRQAIAAGASPESLPQIEAAL